MQLNRALRGSLGAALAAPLLIGGLPAVSYADDKSEVLRMRAVGLAADGRCAEASSLVEGGSVPSAGTAAVLLQVGKCWIDAGNFAEALTALESAGALAPELANVDLYLGVSRYHLDDLNGAEDALQDAVGQTSEDVAGQLELYTGLVLLARAENREAALALERARRLSPDEVEPVASYYAALAWRQVEERDRAEQALRRVIDRDPESEWARRAGDALGASEAAERWWARAMAGLEYDTNVILRGKSVTLPRQVSDEEDGRALWGAQVGVDLLRTPDWYAGAMLDYTGSAHFDLNEFDWHYPTASILLDRGLFERTRARLRYDFGFGWVDDDAYVRSHRGTLSFLRDWQAGGVSDLSASVYRNDFLFKVLEVPDNGPTSVFRCMALTTCGPPGLRESRERDRDGTGVSATLDHSVPLGFAGASIFGGYTFDYYDSEGKDYKSTSHEGRLGFDVTLPLDIVFTGMGSYRYQPYRHPSSFPDPDVVNFLVATFMPPPLFVVYPIDGQDRKDHFLRGTARFARRFGRHVEASLRYRYENNRSNTKVFDYTRHVVGAYVEVFIP